MIINIKYDMSVTSQSQAFQTQFDAAVNAAVAFYEHVFTNNMTITINVGWNEVEGHSINSGNLAQSQFLAGTDLNYSQVYNALQNDTNTSDNVTAFGTLPANDPTFGGHFRLTSAEMEAFGLTNNVGPTNDLYIGLSSSVSWTFDPSNRAVSGEHDAIGAIEHEISEVMGRYGSLGQAFGTNIYTPLDLFRYASAGARQLTYGAGFFSIEGQTLLKQYNDPSNGADAVDWLHPADGGSFGDSYGNNGTDVISRVTATDLREMNIIGYNRGPLTADNFNGNGVSDILFRNDSSGDVGWYNMQGSLVAWNDIGGSSTAYNVVGTGDFFGNRVSDILFRNNATGDVGYYQMTYDGVFAGWRDIAGSATAYSVVGVGDFNGDGTSDILFRNNTSGDTGFYAINNGAFAGWHDIAGSSTAYSVVGVGDFDKNGTSDVLFRNNATGDIGYYAINAGGVFAGWRDIGGSSTAYAVVGVGDFYGNGSADILFRNNTTGDLGFYAMNGGVFGGWHDLGGSSTAYSVAAVGDYYGNGTSDILFRNNTTGDTGYYAISNGALSVNPFTNSSWHDIGLSSTAYRIVA
jgi:hypothetical protein